jgi:exopolyphosphatase/guanosine-5'-triphosphate,3'-diphosphate pyrophosphatase
MPRFASLDVGSNTVRLLIAERLSSREFRPLRVERIITRLGGAFSAAGGLNESSMERTVEGIRTLADLSKKDGVKKVFAVGTGVLREAKNQESFMERVERRTGIPLRLLSGVEEANLMLQGVLGSLKDKTLPRLVTDVGGWSTEILWVEGEVPRETVSLRLGVVELTEGFLKGDPPLNRELGELETHSRSLLREIGEQWKNAGRRVRDLHPNLIGTAGTATTLAAIDLGLTPYDPQKVNGHLIPLHDLKDIYHRLRSLPVRERQKVPGLEKGREDLIIAGAVILLNLLQVFDLTTLEVIDSGLLEGVLLEGIAKS